MKPTCANCGNTYDSHDDPPYDGLCAFYAWQKWFMLSGGDKWNKVECIACELGRRCDEHGRTGDEP